MENQLSKFSFLQSRLSLPLLGILVLLGVAGATVAINPFKSTPPQTKSTVTATPKPSLTPVRVGTLPYTILYGTWSGNSSVIKSFDLQTNTASIVATLPFTVKNISYIAPNKLLFIDQLDTRDYGKSLTLYDISSKNRQTVFTAEEDFGINSYILSPNKKYAAVWEVAFSSASEALTGGKSRVYVINMTNPSVKNLIFNDVNLSATSPAHWPIAITNTGDVFADAFVPNTIRGWAHGLSVSNFDGTIKQTIAEMASGTYASQPIMSPDGKYLAFVGYSGKDGDGNIVTADGYRQAMVSADTMELFDLQARVRRKIDILPSSNTYYAPMWDASSQKLYFPQIGPKPEDMGLFEYSLSTNQVRKISLPDDHTFASSITGAALLTGITDDSQSVTGRLGPGYYAPFSKFSVTDTDGSLVSDVSLTDQLMQYISLIPSEDISSLNLPSNSIGVCDGNTNLQLCSFRVEPQLVEKRIEQENEPPQERDRPKTNSCIILAGRQCQDKGYDHEKNLAEYKACVKSTAQVLREDGTQCTISPLYLYAEEGTSVSVTAHTPTYNASPSFSKTISVTTGKNNTLRANGKTYESLSFDYEPAIRVQPPSYGKIVEKKNLASTLAEYSDNLGLTTREKNDLIQAVTPQVTTPFVFVSYFDHDVSKYILPLTFDPKPDTYINLVFYIEQLPLMPKYTPVPPPLKKYPRNGFTAVEISHMIVE